MIEDPDGGVWIADFFTSQLVRFDPDTGEILERYDADDGLCDTDDVVVAPDDSLVATCPGAGSVIRVERGGRATLLADVGKGVNPIALDPAGDAVLVGFESIGIPERDELLRVPLDGGPVEVVTTGLPQLNGFDVGDDGMLWVPTGGALGIFGGGGLGRIDLATGEFTEIGLTFPSPSKTGFALACGTDAAPDGTVYVAQCIDASLWAVDPASGAVTQVGPHLGGVADNVLLLSDGRILLSSFAGARVTVFEPAAGGTWITRDRPIGSW
jgi:streptogramin lyase